MRCTSSIFQIPNQRISKPQTASDRAKQSEGQWYNVLAAVTVDVSLSYTKPWQLFLLVADQLLWLQKLRFLMQGLVGFGK